MFWCAYGSLRLVNGISGGQRGFSGVSRSVPDLYQGVMEVSEAFQDHLEGSGASQEIPKDFRRFPGMCQGSSGFLCSRESQSVYANLKLVRSISRDLWNFLGVFRIVPVVY